MIQRVSAGRAVRHTGRRSVAGKLDEIKKSRAARDPANHWDVFIVNVLAFWVDGIDALVPIPSIHQIDVHAVEQGLRNLGSTRFDKAIPWLWRQWIAFLRGPEEGGVDRALVRFRSPLTRDWYRELRPNLTNLTMAQANAQADFWHAKIAEEARLRGMGALSKVHREPFTPVRRFKDGFFITRYDVVEGASHKHLQALGKLLGHCYAFPRNAQRYGEDYDLWTLFDAWRPCWTLTTTSMGDRAYPPDIRHIQEVKGSFNMPVRPEHFPHLEAFLRPSVRRFGMSDDAYDYFNAEALHAYAKKGSVRAFTNYIEFVGTNGRVFRAEAAEMGQEHEFHLSLKSRHLFYVLSEHEWEIDYTASTIQDGLDLLLRVASNIPIEDWPSP